MDTDDTWSVATAEDDGKPLVFRIRNQPPSFAQKEDFSQLLSVVWQYEPAGEQGMPSQEDLERMSQLEDLLVDAFEGAGQAFLTIIATGNGVREWQWYARDVEEVMTLVNKTLSKFEPFPIEFNFQEDPDWVGYSQFRDIG